MSRDESEWEEYFYGLNKNIIISIRCNTRSHTLGLGPLEQVDLDNGVDIFTIAY